MGIEGITFVLKDHNGNLVTGGRVEINAGNPESSIGFGDYDEDGVIVATKEKLSYNAMEVTNSMTYCVTTSFTDGDQEWQSHVDHAPFEWIEGSIINITIPAPSTERITFTITDEDGNAVSDALVQINGTCDVTVHGWCPIYSAKTDINGVITVPVNAFDGFNGPFTYGITAPGSAGTTGSFDTSDRNVNITLNNSGSSKPGTDETVTIPVVDEVGNSLPSVYVQVSVYDPVNETGRDDFFWTDENGMLTVELQGSEEIVTGEGTGKAYSSENVSDETLLGYVNISDNGDDGYTITIIGYVLGGSETIDLYIIINDAELPAGQPVRIGIFGSGNTYLQNQEFIVQEGSIVSIPDVFAEPFAWNYAIRVACDDYGVDKTVTINKNTIQTAINNGTPITVSVIQ